MTRRRLTTFRVPYAESACPLPGYGTFKEKLSFSVYHTRKLIAKHSKKWATMLLFCQSFVARSLAYHFPRTIPQKVICGKGIKICQDLRKIAAKIENILWGDIGV